MRLLICALFALLLGGCNNTKDSGLGLDGKSPGDKEGGGASIEDCCEALAEVLQESLPPGEQPYGGVTCCTYDTEEGQVTKVIVCDYEENYTEPDDDEKTKELLKECIITRHEGAHKDQAEALEPACSPAPAGGGEHPPTCDLDTPINEALALADEMKCWKEADCTGAADVEECEQTVDELHCEACDKCKKLNFPGGDEIADQLEEGICDANCPPPGDCS